MINVAPSEKKQTAETEEPVTQFTESTEAIVSFKEPHSSHFHNPEKALTVSSFNILRLTHMQTLHISLLLLTVFSSWKKSQERDEDVNISAAVLPWLNPEGGTSKGTQG